MQDSNNPFFDFLSWVQYLAISCFIGSILFLIYIPHSDSIDQSFVEAFLPYPQEAIDQSKTKYVYENPNKVINGIHVKTGLVYDQNFVVVKQVCTRCHSAKLISQSKADREGWTEMIRWMQKTQGLEDLGDYEVKILDYLSTHYAPEEIGRRQPLDTESIDWYILDI